MLPYLQFSDLFSFSMINFRIHVVTNFNGWIIIANLRFSIYVTLHIYNIYPHSLMEIRIIFLFCGFHKQNIFSRLAFYLFFIISPNMKLLDHTKTLVLIFWRTSLFFYISTQNYIITIVFKPVFTKFCSYLFDEILTNVW